MKIIDNTIPLVLLIFSIMTLGSLVVTPIFAMFTGLALGFILQIIALNQE